MFIRLTGFIISTFVFLGMFALAASAEPVVSQPNTLGIYFDEEATEVCAQIQMGTSFSFYVVLTNPTFSTIKGFEYGFDVLGDDFYVLSWTFPRWGADISDPQNVVFGFVDPLPCTEATVLCSMQGWIPNSGQFDFVLHGSSPGSLPGELPVVLLPDSVLFQLHTSVPGGGPCLQINGECGVVGVEQQSWDQVKALFVEAN